MSTIQQIKAANQRCAFLVRLIDEAETSADPKRKAVLYSIAHVECDNLARTLDSALFPKTHKLHRPHAA